MRVRMATAAAALPSHLHVPHPRPSPAARCTATRVDQLTEDRPPPGRGDVTTTRHNHETTLGRNKEHSPAKGRGASGYAEFLCLRGAGRAQGRGRRATGAGRRSLTGPETPLLQFDEASRLQQRVEEAHGGGRQAGSGRRHGPRGPGAPAVTPRLAAGHAPAGDSRGRASRRPIPSLRAHHVAFISTNQSGRLLNAIDARVAGKACDAARFVYCLYCVICSCTL